MALADRRTGEITGEMCGGVQCGTAILVKANEQSRWPFAAVEGHRGRKEGDQHEQLHLGSGGRLLGEMRDARTCDSKE